MPISSIEVQGHRGACGLLPENTLPSFEIALDFGVSSVETDLHLTRDNAIVLFHDPRLADAESTLIRTMTFAETRQRCIDNGSATPLAWRYATARRFNPYCIPSLAELFDFVDAYAGRPGEQVGKSKWQQERARRLIFDLDLKRFPFLPETVDDGFTGGEPGFFERQVVAAIRDAGMLERTRVRCFDHRSASAIKQLEPNLTTGLLIYGTVPKDIAHMLQATRADVYCPDYYFVDAEVVEQVHAAGKRIMPYTVNQANEWERLVRWGVDGITTDFPDRLASWLTERGLKAA